ncbi:MAG: sigma-70 family RNA polymerase sigma factor, partial [Saprospiraceae bacterium]|nr:sigma-70 family RNA polymerase sigma factor [Saprospiraceae bacterium]
PEQVPSPEFLLEEKEFKRLLEDAISALPEGQRAVFLLNRIDKKTYREIAEDLSISAKAVEKRMHKALASLRKIHKKV